MIASVPLAHLVTPVSSMSLTIKESCAACAGSGIARIVQAASADAAAEIKPQTPLRWLCREWRRPHRAGCLSRCCSRDPGWCSFLPGGAGHTPRLVRSCAGEPCTSPVQGADAGALCHTLCRPPGFCCNDLEGMLPCGAQGRAFVTQFLCVHCCIGENRPAYSARKPGHRSRCQEGLHVGHCTCEHWTKPLCCLPTLFITWRSCLNHGPALQNS